MLAEKFRTGQLPVRIEEKKYFEFYNDMVKLQPINFLDMDIIKLTNSLGSLDSLLVLNLASSHGSKI
jgi:hypothetical protein